MGRHAEWCRREQTECQCLTCKHDSLFDSPACCSRSELRFNPDDKTCGVADCPAYEREEPEDEGKGGSHE